MKKRLIPSCLFAAALVLICLSGCDGSDKPESPSSSPSSESPKPGPGRKSTPSPEELRETFEAAEAGDWSRVIEMVNARPGLA